MVTTEQKVTLILGEDRIECIRDDLASKSEYFAALLSSKFNDGLKNEHHINYEIEAKTLQNFVKWTSDHSTDSNSGEFDWRNVNPSLAGLVGPSAEIDDVLKLLQLSVLFVAQTLVEELTNLIVCCWLDRSNSLSVWLLAEELNLVTLRDLAKVVCIDYIYEFPEDLLLELPKEKFLELLTNFYSQFDNDFLENIILKWNERNPNSCLKINRFNDESGKQDQYVDELFKSSIHCVVGRKKTKDNKPKACVYSWDGENSSVTELVELRCSSMPFAKDIVGRQVVARGFDIYCIGGEYGLGTGRFELDIWRYSTISKTWYYVTRWNTLPYSLKEICFLEKHSRELFYLFLSLLEPRRHMAVQFINERLFLIGGVGRHRLKLSSVHVYNFRTGEWSKAADVPETFTSVPLVYSHDGAIYLYKSHVYVYIVVKDCWLREGKEEISSHPLSYFPEWIQYLTVYRDKRYFIYSEDSGCRRISSIVVENNGIKIDYLGKFATPFDNQTLFFSDLICFCCKDETVSIEKLKIEDSETLVPVVVHNEKRSDIHDFYSEAPVGCFSIFKVSSLNKRNAVNAPYIITSTDS